MIFRPFLHEPTACASYLFGCLGKSRLAVVDPHVELVESYLEAAERAGAPIAAVFETHLQADHVSGLSKLVELTGATPYRPESLSDGDIVELGNTVVTVLATPGHAPVHNSFLVADRRRGTDDPWLVFTGDSMLVGDVGRPDLHASGDAEGLARRQFMSIQRLLALPDYVLVYPTHFGGSVCGRHLSSNPFSTIGFERRHNKALAFEDAGSFAHALLADLPPPPADQEAILALNRA